MRERHPRRRPIQSFRHEVVDGDREDPREDDDSAPPIVVHVHVHGDEDGHLGGQGVPQIVVNAVQPKAPRRRPAPPPRLALTGRLFDWRGHYDLVAKRHADAGLRPTTRWTALLATVRQAFTHSRRG